MTSLYQLLDEFRKTANSTRELGNKFEHLVLIYLKSDPIYKERFSHVWLWMDFPKRGKDGDTGIDLVAEEADTGEYCAIQCKCYDEQLMLDKKDIDSFFTASGKELYSSRIIVSTTDHWSSNAEKALKNQTIPIIRLSYRDMANSPIDWSQFSLKNSENIVLKAKKTLRPHQTLALEKAIAHFQTCDRGRLIMACGTGKTFTSLKIAEKMAGNQGFVLFLVPSISLLSQTLREWTAETSLSLHSLAVCSDSKVGKRSDTEDLHTYDLPIPATTDANKITDHIKALGSKKELTVIFSTYQSIQVISDAQKQGLPKFDLIICDEAHRTTGLSEKGKKESYFLKVHDERFINSKKRLYMTATPKLYNDNSKTKAKENEALLCSMDDEAIYGEEFHRLGFAEAVAKGLLSDYKVMVLAVDEKYVSKTFQYQLADENNELNLDDAVKITGCWNGLSRRMTKDANGEEIIDDTPMKRAVAFSSRIKDSKRITELFSQIIQEYRKTHPEDEQILDCQLDHVDGTLNSLIRNQKLDWLRENPPESTCRILSNARCLSEGVDVPALDAVMFLSPRNSVVDVVQSVGRVMRKAEGKNYGYIILPIGIPANMPPEEALKDHQKYKVVWQVLQALRAHDDRFNITINQIELNKQRPQNINVIGVGGENAADEGDSLTVKTIQTELIFPGLEEWRDAIYAQIVVKCGDRRYWEDWAKDVAVIADHHISRIQGILQGNNPRHREAFEAFLNGLQSNLNPSISEDDAIEMLSQHLITKPVFNALFEDYEFTKLNPVSLAMQQMLDALDDQALEKETKSLNKFYESVRQRASKIDNAEGKQKVVIELYDKFFKTAFPRTADKLGIVYTPIEVVDFIINSVDVALKQEFNVGLTDKGVHILDPFTGTGSFIVRLLQSGLIKPEDLPRKFSEEIHANEIILLAYYIAAINIESTYHDLINLSQETPKKAPLSKGSWGDQTYKPFNGIVLTDTFQMFQNQGTFREKMFPENNQRVVTQKEKEITAIIGNPPYSAGQKSENDSNKNLKYEQLDQRIAITYANHSTATNKNSLYDSYIRSIRWASDRIGKKGIIGFVTNGSFIDNNAMDGLRKCLTDDFTAIYCFNLRGNARTSGEERRKEKGNIFGEGTRTPVAITLLIKNPEKREKAQLFYHDIGDYLSGDKKLEIIRKFSNLSKIEWQKITPNESHDWINQRDPAFETFISLGDKKDQETQTIFDVYSRGISTSRDAWCYNFSTQELANNMNKMINFYNSQVEEFKEYLKHQTISNSDERKKQVESFINTDLKKISWSVGLKNDLGKFIIHEFYTESMVKGMYRPYCKQWAYFNKNFNDRRYQTPKIFPNESIENLVICVTGRGSSKDFSVLISSILPDLEFISKSQCFPLYTYEKQEKKEYKPQIPGLETDNEYVKNENIPNIILNLFRSQYNHKTLTKEDIFYYIYGILHSPEYKQRFAADLKKMLPRIPFAEDFWLFSKAGRDLADWHLNYENIEPYPLKEYQTKLYLKPEEYRVEKMAFGKRNQDKTSIMYNQYISLTEIPLSAYNYIVNGKSAIEWIMERYKYTKDKKSGLINDPNKWSDDPRYIIELVKRIVRVSVETVKIVDSLPPLNEKNKP